MFTTTVTSTRSIEALDVTDAVAALVPATAGGLAIVRIRHTSAALLIGPGDVGMLADFERMGERWLAGLRPFEHLENNNPNGEAHLLSSLFGTALTVPVTDGRLEFGTWQRIILLDFDGPATRTIECRVFA